MNLAFVLINRPSASHERSEISRSMISGRNCWYCRAKNNAYLHPRSSRARFPRAGGEGMRSRIARGRYRVAATTPALLSSSITDPRDVTREVTRDRFASSPDSPPEGVTSYRTPCTRPVHSAENEVPFVHRI